MNKIKVQNEINESIIENYSSKKFSIHYRGVKISSILSVLKYWEVLSPSSLEEYTNEKFDYFNKDGFKKLLHEKKSNTSVIKEIKHIIYLGLKLLQNKDKRDIPQIDLLISIDNIKYLKYIEAIKNELAKKDNYIVIINWDSKTFTEIKDRKEQIILFSDKVRLNMPIFWKKSYWKFRSITKLIENVFSIITTYNTNKLFLIEGDHPRQHIIGHLSKTVEYETICLQWGYCGTSTYKLPWHNMPYHKFLSWGEFFSNSFKKFNTNLEIENVGHPSLKFLDKTSFKKNYILFGIPKEMFPFISKSDIDLFINFAIDFSKKQSKYKVRFRVHPNSDFINNYGDIGNIEIHDYFNNSFIESFDSVKFCVNISSTLNLEAIYFGVLPVYLRINNIPLLLHDELSTFFNINIVAEMDGNFLTFLDNLEENQNKIFNKRKELFFATDKEVIERIINAI